MGDFKESYVATVKFTYKDGKGRMIGQMVKIHDVRSYEEAVEDAKTFVRGLQKWRTLTGIGGFTIDIDKEYSYDESWS